MGAVLFYSSGAIKDIQFILPEYPTSLLLEISVLQNGLAVYRHYFKAVIEISAIHANPSPQIETLGIWSESPMASPRV